VVANITKHIRVKLFLSYKKGELLNNLLFEIFLEIWIWIKISRGMQPAIGEIIYIKTPIKSNGAEKGEKYENRVWN
jgi:hypothetical protein